MSHEKRLGWAALVFGLLGVGVVYLWPEAKWIGQLFILGAVCCVIAWGYLEFKERKSKKPKKLEESKAVTATEWNDLASKFQKFAPAYVRAEWYSESLDWDGKLIGERWLVRDDWNNQYASQCEALCRLAGAMLLKSPKVLASLSEKVRTRSDDVFRWLYFISERKNIFTRELTSDVRVGMERKQGSGKTIPSLSTHSANACLECAAKEI